MAEPLVVMEGIEKTFPGVHCAQPSANLSLCPGEVHCPGRRKVAPGKSR